VATSDQNVVTYEAVLAVDNSDLLLRPGMTATASVVTQHKQGVLLVPNAALRFTPPDVAAANQDQRRGIFLPGITRGGPGGGGRQQQRSGGSRNRGEAGAAGATGATGGNASDNPFGARGGRRRGGASGTVWVLREGKPVSVEVTTGATDGRNTEVHSRQLKAGDEVIVDVVVQEKKGAS
jgi:HlyD family secretion protein